MPNYLSASACRGRRPKTLSVPYFRSRPTLVSKLLKERSVTRFIVAPDGFGKTQLAFEYADVVFAFAGTFWLDARSPCFLRDLDKGVFSSGISAKDPNAQLVVFDAVPQLDAARSDAFSSEIDKLLAAGIEVLVTMVPSSDAYASRQPDRVLVTASDLLLSKSELTDSDAHALHHSLAARVPVVAWSEDKGLEKLIKAFVAEGLPASTQLVAFRMLAFLTGGFDELVQEDLASFVVRRELTALAQAYPYFEIDEVGERFAAPELSARALIKAFEPCLAALAYTAHAASSDILVINLAHELVNRRNAQRACQYAACASSRLVRETWLIEHDCELVNLCCLEPACTLYEAARPTRESGEGKVMATEALRHFVLSDHKQAFELALGLTSSAAVSDEVRAFAGIIAIASALDASQREAAQEVLNRAMFAKWRLFDEGSSALVSARPWRVAATIVICAANDLPLACELWERAYTLKANEIALVASASTIAAHSVHIAAHDAEKLAASLACIASFLYAYIDTHVSPDGVGLWALNADRSLTQLRPFVAQTVSTRLSASTSEALHAAAVALAEQRVSYVAHQSGNASRDVLHISRTYASSGQEKKCCATSSPPTLRIELFGGMAVSIGGQPVNERSFSRRKIKTLLALLALDAGREIPRDRLAEAIWPASSIDSARKNIYSLWSLLKRALTLPDGSCPYLTRMSNGYKLEDAWLESDARRIDEICRALLFGSTDAEKWLESLNELGILSAGGLMPCETANDEIALRRREYHVRIVDALVGASRRLADEGDAQASLWFARAAFELERFREDVYCALMRAQIASGQRASALATFFDCKRFLADGLGIDPSAEAVSLYRSIIEEEATLEW